LAPTDRVDDELLRGADERDGGWAENGVMEKLPNLEDLVAVTFLADGGGVSVVVVVEELVLGSIVDAGLPIVEFACPGRAVEPLTVPESVIADREASVKEPQAAGGGGV
jgi:hypothetical protein